MSEKNIAVLGLGYVGLPLALELSLTLNVKGFDVNNNRINQLRKGIDSTLEVDPKKLLNQQKNKKLLITKSQKDLKNCNIFIATVPTPIDSKRKPDFTALLNVCKVIGPLLKKKDIVVFESTVFPGATEEICGPELEKCSNKLKCGEDFFLGYSPERVNPGDKIHTIDKINKVISGQNAKVEKELFEIYSKLTEGKVFLAKSIKVAEAAKVIENCQRDINIAFVNELAKIFNLLEIDTNQVLKAAGTKWNFIPFKPGLVGGHCIGIDPYYLAQKAQEVGYHPEIILSGRRLNDSMGEYVANEVTKLMVKKSIKIIGSKALVLGITFKENCPDVRNTKVVQIISTLKKYGVNVDIYDPQASIEEVKSEFGLDMLENIENKYDAIILAVAHDDFLKLDLKKFTLEKTVIYDIKGVLEMPGIYNL